MRSQLMKIVFPNSAVGNRVHAIITAQEAEPESTKQFQGFLGHSRDLLVSFPLFLGRLSVPVAFKVDNSNQRFLQAT